MIRRTLAVTALAMMAGCGGASSTNNGDMAGPPDYCAHPPTNVANQVVDSYDASPMPAKGTATGGTIVSGTYAMTAITYYGQASGSNNEKNTLVIDSTAKVFAVDLVNGGTQEPAIAGTFTLSGAVMNQTFQCPQVMTTSVEYTASATQLVVYNYDANSVSTWTLQ